MHLAWWVWDELGLPVVVIPYVCTAGSVVVRMHEVMSSLRRKLARALTKDMLLCENRSMLEVSMY